MPRTAITVQEVSDENDIITMTFAACDLANGNEFTIKGNEVVLQRNDDVSSQTMTWDSKADQFNRVASTAQEAEALAAAGYQACGYRKPERWAAGTNLAHLDWTDADQQVAVLRFVKSTPID